MYSIDFFEAWNILNKLNEDADYGTIQSGILYTDIIEEYNKLQNEKTDENSINFWCNVIDTIKRIPNGSGTYLDTGIDRSISYMVNAYLAEHALVGKQIILNNQGFNNKVFTLEWYTSNDATKERLIGKRGDNTPDFRCTESRLTFDVKNKETAEVCKDMTFNKYIKNGNAHGSNILLFVAEDDKSVWFCNKNYPNNTATQVKSSIDNNFKIEPAYSFLDRTSTIAEDFISQSIKYPKMEVPEKLNLGDYDSKFKNIIIDTNKLISEANIYKDQKSKDTIEENNKYIEELTNYNNRLEDAKYNLLESHSRLVLSLNNLPSRISVKYTWFVNRAKEKLENYCLNLSNSIVLNNEHIEKLKLIITNYLDEPKYYSLSNKIRNYRMFNPYTKVSEAERKIKIKYKNELNLICTEFLKLTSVIDKSVFIRNEALNNIDTIQKTLYGNNPETKQGGYIFEINEIQKMINEKILYAEGQIASLQNTPEEVEEESQII